MPRATTASRHALTSRGALDPERKADPPGRSVHGRGSGSSVRRHFGRARCARAYRGFFVGAQVDEPAPTINIPVSSTTTVDVSSAGE